MSHGSDLVHLYMDEEFPIDVCASGGIYAWQDGRENPDTFQALATYPKGFLYSFATSFGNGYGSYTRIYGKSGTLISIGGEGSPRWKITPEDGGGSEGLKEEKYVTVPGFAEIQPTHISDDSKVHINNWFECMRTRRQPNATVHHGFSHSVVVIMAAQAYWKKRTLFWDRKNEQILEYQPEK